MAVKHNRKRYILFRALSSRNIHKELVETALQNSAKALFGEIGKPNMKLLSEFAKKDCLVIETNHKDVAKSKLAMAMVGKIGPEPVILFSQKVFGTLKKVKYIFKEVI